MRTQCKGGGRVFLKFSFRWEGRSGKSRKPGIRQEGRKSRGLNPARPSVVPKTRRTSKTKELVSNTALGPSQVDVR